MKKGKNLFGVPLGEKLSASEVSPYMWMVSPKIPKRFSKRLQECMEALQNGYVAVKKGKTK